MIKQIIKIGFNLGKTKTAQYLYWVFSGNAALVVLAFFTTILIARGVTKEAFGIYLALYTFASLLAELGDAGIGSSLSRFIPPLVNKHKYKQSQEVLATAFKTEMTIGAVLVLLTIILSPLISSSLFGDVGYFYVILSTTIVVGMMLINFSILSLSAYKRFPESAVVTVLFGITRLLIVFIISMLDRLTLTNVLFAFAFSPFIAWFFSLIYLRLNFLTIKVDFAGVKRIISFSSFLGLQKLFVGVAARLDMLMLVPLAGAFEAGVYGAASRIALIYPFFITAFSQVIAPRFAEYKKGKEALGFFKKSGLVIVAFIFSIGIFFLIADTIIPLFFGARYVDAIPVFKWLLVSMTGFVAASPFMSFLVYTLKRPQIVALASFVQMIIIFVFNLIFIPKLGRFGPAIGIGIGNFIVFIIALFTTLYLLKREL